MHVHVVEDDNYAREQVIRLLTSLGHKVTVTRVAPSIVGRLADDPDPVDLILADLPADRVEATQKALRVVHRRHPDIPVVLRVSSALLPATEALHCGVFGYLRKPFRPEELELLLLRLVERRESQSFRDRSGLYSRPGFSLLAQQQLKAAARTRTQMVLLRADVGQEAQDPHQAVSQLGHIVQRTFRDADLAGRVDGTDCGVLLLNASVEQTEVALRRLHENLRAHNAAAPQPLQVRVGRAHFDPERPCSFAELVARADDSDSTDPTP